MAFQEFGVEANCHSCSGAELLKTAHPHPVFSMFDGIVRFDVARGFYLLRQTRVAAYLEARF